MKKLLLIVVPLLILLGIYAFLHLKRNDTHRSLVPKDAQAVAVVYPKKLKKATNLTTDEIMEMLFDGKSGDIGLNQEQPFYMFLSPNRSVGLAMGITSEKKFIRWLEHCNLEITQEKVFKWSKLDDKMLVFDKHRLLIIRPAELDNATPSAFVSMFGNNAIPSPLIDMAMKQDGVAGYAAYFDDNLLDYFGISIADILPLNLSMNETVLCGSLQFSDKEIKVKSSLITDNHVLTDFIEALDEVAKPLNDNLPRLAPDNPQLSMWMNIDGEQLLPLLRSFPQLRTSLLALNLVVDADMMISSIDGDVQFSIPEYQKEQSNWLLTARLKDSSFLKNVRDWQQGNSLSFMQFQALTDNDFHLVGGDISMYFGVRNERLYLTPNRLLSGIACIELPTETSDTRIVPGSRMYACLDATSFTPFSDSSSYVDNLRLNVLEGPSIEVNLECKVPAGECLKAILSK